MTDSDIIQSMHSCANDTTCAKCLYQQHYQNGCCQSKLIGDALDLINRQQAEIERLKESLGQNVFIVGRGQGKIHAAHQFIRLRVSEIERQAIKNFAERLKARAYTAENEWSHGNHPLVVEVDDIDELVAEMEV